MINLGSILKGRDITLLTKILVVKAIVFPVVMYGCWTKKKVIYSVRVIMKGSYVYPPGRIRISNFGAGEDS